MGTARRLTHKPSQQLKACVVRRQLTALAGPGRRHVLHLLSASPNQRNQKVRHYDSDVTEGTSKLSEPFPVQELPYNSVEIDVSTLYIADSSEFATRLFLTMMSQKKKGKGAMYLKIDMIHSHLIPIAATFDFLYHRAEGQEAYLLKWLPDSPCKVPPTATHHCGVGALILRGGEEILVVKEKSKLTGWKLPGGYVDRGEDFGVAAAREVMEETGIDCEMESIVRLRHSHEVQFDYFSDIYVICLMRYKGGEIRIDEEIQDCQWMKVTDFLENNKHPMHKEIVEALRDDKTLFDERGWRETQMSSTIPGKRAFHFYSPAIKK